MTETVNKYNNLTIIERVDNDKNGNVVFKCKCDCGNIVNVTKSHLINGHTKSCGCLNHKVVDLVGEKHDRLEVVEFVRTENKQACWLVHCDCGNELIMASSQFKNYKSCGCLNDEVRKLEINERMKFYNGTSILSISETRKHNRNSQSKIKGVCYDPKRKKWVAQIMIKGKSIYLGRFDDVNGAIAARAKAEEEYFKPIVCEYEKTHLD
ncbi:MAG: AP2/ERF family transcription factor [Erysipelotrichaceae bacterium]